MNTKLVAVSAASFAAGVVATTAAVGVIGIIIYRDITRTVADRPRPNYRYTPSSNRKTV